MKIDDLRRVFAELTPADGWTCVALTNYSVTLRHAEHEGDLMLIKGRDY